MLTGLYVHRQGVVPERQDRLKAKQSRRRAGQSLKQKHGRRKLTTLKLASVLKRARWLLSLPGAGFACRVFEEEEWISGAV